MPALMTSPLARSVLAVVATIALIAPAACHNSKPASTTAPAPSSAHELPPDMVVATFGDQKITAAQLDEKVKPELEEMEEQYQKQRHQLRQQTLDRMVMENLLEAEAKKRGLASGEALIKAEVEDKVPAPSDDEVQKLYESSKGRLPPGATFEQFKPQIVEFMTRQQKQDKARELFERLRKEANVSIKLPEPPKQRKQVEPKGPSRGPENAPITIVEFSDFECPFCGRAHDTVEQVMKEYEGKVRLVFRHFPLDFHPNAQKAAEASLCAHDQGKFWEYHDLLFQNREKLQVPQLKEHAKSVGLDEAKFAECVESGKHAKAVTEDMEAAKKVGVSGTPAFFINGVMLSGAQPLEEFKKIIDAELAAK